jgi:nitrate reductase alpha subunit
LLFRNARYFFIPSRQKVTLADGKEVKVATVFDLMMANYSVDQGLGGKNV